MINILESYVAGPVFELAVLVSAARRADDCALEPSKMKKKMSIQYRADLVFTNTCILAAVGGCGS